MKVEDVDQELMRSLAFKYQYRRYTNTNPYTEQELQEHVELFVWMKNLCDPDRCKRLSDALSGSR